MSVEKITNSKVAVENLNKLKGVLTNIYNKNSEDMVLEMIYSIDHALELFDAVEVMLARNKDYADRAYRLDNNPYNQYLKTISPMIFK